MYGFYLKLKYGIRPNKPILMARVFKKLLKAKLTGKPGLKYADVAYDYACNLKCEHCFARKFKPPKGGRKMTIDDHRKFVKEAMAMGALDFNLQGGEPLLTFDELLELIKVYQPSKNFISITTNAYLFTEEKLKILKKAGVDMIVFSLDSGDYESHDKFRGVKGVYNKVTKAIDLCEKHGMHVVINTTVSHDSIRSKGFERLIDYIESKHLFTNTIFAVPIGAWQGRMDVVLTKEDVEYMEKLRKDHMLLRRDIDSNFGGKGCGAVKEAIYLTAYGDVLPCPFIHIALGNVITEPLQDIIDRALKIKYFDHYHPTCLASENKAFIKKYDKWAKASDEFPMKFDNVVEKMNAE